MEKYVDIVFDGPPSHEAGRFVEVENEAGASIKFGTWVQREDGYWCLRIPSPDRLREAAVGAVEALGRVVEKCQQYENAPRLEAAEQHAVNEWIERDALAALSALRAALGEVGT